MSKNPNWSVEEIALLKQCYPKLGSHPEIEKIFPGRNAKAIALKASRLGIKVEENIREKRTHEEYLELLEPTNFVVLEEYRGSTVPIMHMCSICEYEWLARPQQCLKPRAMCPACSKNNRLTSLVEVDRVLRLAGFVRLSEYTGALNPITLRHIYCGYEWDTVYSHIQQKSGCPICNKGFGFGMAKENMPEKANIYLLNIETKTERYLKLGVTTRDVHRRVIELKSAILDLVEIQIIYQTSADGLSILKREKSILGTSARYFTKIKFGGCTELLSIENDIKLIIGKMNGKIV